MIPYHRTKIVATLGPATDSTKVLEQCLRSGLDIVRLNAAHGTKQDQIQRVRSARRVARRLGVPLGLLVDLPGPKFRLGDLPGGFRELRRGEWITLELADAADQKSIPIRNRAILTSIRPNHLLHLADGTVTLRAVRCTGLSVLARVIVGGLVRSGSGINLPDTDVELALPTAADIQALSFAASQKAEWIGVSFVRSARDLARMRRVLARFRYTPRVIAKIEKRLALENLDEILAAADGVMVARGDLGVEAPLQEVPLAQKRIIARANEMGKPVVTATQMLESMVSHSRPTRAEVTDIANAVLDGTDAVMLSAETAVGRYPGEAVRMLASVLSATEQAYPFRAILDARAAQSWNSREDAISHSSCRLAWDVGAKAIVLSSPCARLPYALSRFRPSVPIVVLTDNRMTAQQLCLSWGVIPVLTTKSSATTLEPARRKLLGQRLAKNGDFVVWIHSNKSRPSKSNGEAVELTRI